MDFALVRDNLARVRERIARTQAREGRSGDVRLIAVTKGHPADAIAAAAAAGLEDIGENRVQEALAKREEALDQPVCWHLIGHLQTNKARFVPGTFSVVHSVDSAKVAEALAAAMKREHEGSNRDLPPLRVLLQVNVAGETQKSGGDPDQAAALARKIAEHPELALEGLMTMAPFVDDETVQRKVFGRLRELRDCLAADGIPVTELSMGMSGDFESAVAEGATMVRLGTVLFGERKR